MDARTRITLNGNTAPDASHGRIFTRPLAFIIRSRLKKSMIKFKMLGNTAHFYGENTHDTLVYDASCREWYHKKTDTYYTTITAFIRAEIGDHVVNADIRTRLHKGVLG